jgi:phosphoglycerate kinase
LVTNSQQVRGYEQVIVKQSVADISVDGLRVLVRLDLNVPLSDGGRIDDDRRIRAALPTIRKLIDGNGQLILMSHLGRPGTSRDDRMKYSLAPVANRLSKLLQKPVPLAAGVVGNPARLLVNGLRNRGLCMLENLRFHPAETIKDKDAAKSSSLKNTKETFARELAEMGDVYVNDAFGTCHRDNASMLTLPQMMDDKPKVIGYLVRRELQFLGDTVSDPRRPFVCVLGGAKVSDKLGVIRTLLEKCDTILVGGAMAYTFLASQGVDVGKSLVEKDLIDTARDLLAQSDDKIVLPVDTVAAGEISTDAEPQTCEGDIPESMMGLDIGPKTVEKYTDLILKARTAVWNGPMGVFETPPFDAGTIAIAQALATATKRGATTIVGGGDSASAVDRAGVAHRMTHISTGGGAALEYLEGKSFPAIDVLDDA